MTHEPHVEGRFSELFDETLEGTERDAVLAHLEACEVCREGYASFQAATSALRGLRIAPTTSAHVRDIEQAVAASRRSPFLPRLLTHAAALVVGVTLAWSAGSWAQQTPEVTEVVREVRVEVPVEVLREVPVEVEVVREVPVEVIREVPFEVEVVREVPVIEYVDRPVPTAPLLDFERAYAALETIGDGLNNLADARREEIAALARFDSPRPTALAQADEPDIENTIPTRTDAPLLIDRDGERVRIRTLGSLEDIVPALIENLDDPDQRVALAVEEKLEFLRADLMGDRSVTYLGTTTVPSGPEPFGGLRDRLNSSDGRSGSELDLTAQERWSAWWSEHRDDLVAASSY